MISLRANSFILLVGSYLNGSTLTIILSFLAFTFSIVSLVGCEYVKLHFGVTNDRGIYFQNDEWFGLGLFRHQDFSTNKNSHIWEHDKTCYDYNTMEVDMFRSTNLSTAIKLHTATVIFSSAVLLVLLSLKNKRGRGGSSTVVALPISLISSILMTLSFYEALKSHGTAVCSNDNYSSVWYIDYPPTEYPDVSYMKFFQKCTLGSTGKIALTGIFFQALTTLFCSINVLYGTMVSKVKPIVKIPSSKGPDNDNISNVQIQDEEARNMDFNNEGDLTSSSPSEDILQSAAFLHSTGESFESQSLQPIDEDMEEEEDLSFAEEDDSRGDDDLSMATEIYLTSNLREP